MIKRILSISLCAAVLLGLLALPASAQGTKAPGTVTTQWGSLNVRQSPSAGGALLTTLPKGSYITLISKSGSWWYVEYAKNRYGYCHSDYITQSFGTEAAVTLTYGSLNVRTGPGTSYTAQDWLPDGEQVIVLSSSDGWSRILYHGVKTGYVSARYLTGGNSGAISLKVPSFKQTDSRWANVKIGSSGKTISQIGCATTAIAMMESYRTGTTIYPDAMSKKLSYTASGSVYWPGHYQVSTDSSYLALVLSLLQQGKPVLFGGKTSQGGQHWVVITGYNGGSLSAANFTIQDPGSNSRSTLEQFLRSYPIFYKLFHY